MTRQDATIKIRNLARDLTPAAAERVLARVLAKLPDDGIDASDIEYRFTTDRAHFIGDHRVQTRYEESAEGHAELEATKAAAKKETGAHGLKKDKRFARNIPRGIAIYNNTP